MHASHTTLFPHQGYSSVVTLIKSQSVQVYSYFDRLQLQMKLDPVDYIIYPDDNFIRSLPGMQELRLLPSCLFWGVQPDKISFLESTLLG
jgi:hypothetical protein